jgi:protein tyrosine phosphatase
MSMPPPGTNPPGESPQHSGIITATAVVVSLLVVVLTALVVVIVLFCLMKRKRKSGGMRVMSGWESNTEFTDSQRTTLHGEHLIQLSTLSGSQQALLTGDNGTPVSTPVIRRKNVVESHPVAIDEFALYVESTDDEDLKAEWREIPQRTHDLAAQSLMNPLNNRYTNILPYDKNRVHLKEPNSDGNDYINASYIDGYNVQKSYICAQGPLQRTVDDFWQVVWDHQVNIIVMLTNFIEGQKNKCAEYFPIKENTKVFAKMHMVVVNKSVKVYKDYTLRIFSLENNKTKKSLTVHHFHYTAWPDFGVPKDPSGVLAVLHHARVTRMSHEPSVPVIVHCSAGVGRTGTYLSLDMLMDQVESEGETCVIDIKTLVKNMRDQRNLMVQAPDQYVFIHKAFREHYLVGSTIMSSGEMKKKVEEMSPVKRHSGISQFQEQYEVRMT